MMLRCTANGQPEHSRSVTLILYFRLYRGFYQVSGFLQGNGREYLET
jgi:hypothetical protein